MSTVPTGLTVELLQTLIRNACVNDGRADSGEEVRNADTLTSLLEEHGLDVERYEAHPGRVSIISRIPGTDREAPSLCLMGHTDVVPVNEDGWRHDPFGGELIEGEVWGRGAVDMLNITSSMAVAFCHLATSGLQPRGDLIYFGVADEEAGSSYGAQWMADHHRDAMYADYVLTESGGLHGGTSDQPAISVNVAEKGVAWRRLLIKGTPGHGSMPFRTDNALVKAAAVVQRLADYSPTPRFGELWSNQVEALPVDDQTKALLRDPNEIDGLLARIPSAGTAGYLHACTHTTFSANVVDGGLMKTNVIPDAVELEVDVRTLPGEDAASVDAHLRTALGDLADQVEFEIIMDDPASISRTDNPLWEALDRAVAMEFPSARLQPNMTVGFTDARVYRSLGSVAYGAGLFSPTIDAGEFSRRFHGHNERIDLESLELSTRLWVNVARHLLG
ncbi:MAG: M20/M25/M40 family metallo-hydrolase [Acidimicrobiia bacterium]|nr:M20/M25/M40 family metallo-hydrolase [Acidimicrobiia bacterium]